MFADLKCKRKCCNQYPHKVQQCFKIFTSIKIAALHVYNQRGILQIFTSIYGCEIVRTEIFDPFFAIPFHETLSIWR